ncbi:MAG: metal ABC transporter ATP-binding protein [Clostridia bacterium]|nr:metal ABC transporter ATP-binding protein [Clostridia bacterium]MDR3643917.1 metal ABC transporter ATP-binding protein [Clostridia bacterium]
MSQRSDSFGPEKPCGESCRNKCCTLIKDMNVRIGETQILEHVNIHLHCGELTAVIGPNGAGKSTLVKALLGQTDYTGKVTFFKSDGSPARTPSIGYVAQNPQFDVGTPVSVLDLFIAATTGWPAWLHIPHRLRETAETQLKKVNAEHLIDRRLGALSGGERQRVLFALALCPMPDILLLDEPVSGMDKNGIELFYELVTTIKKEFDLSVLLISHDLPYVEKYADTVILLNRTVLKSGTPSEVYADEGFRGTFYGGGAAQ